MTHHLGIPMIVLGLLGLLSGIQLADSVFGELIRPDCGALLWVLAGFWYLFLDWKLALPFGLFTLGAYFLGRVIPVPALWALFVLGWALQRVGHTYYERKAPSFISNLRHLLIGPFWVFAQWVDYTRDDSTLEP
jgi:uncharacterized membrane protein YGL010W